MLGAGAGDEDPLPPDGQNPHTIPIIIDDFGIWHVNNDGQAHDNPLQNPQDNAAPMIITPPQSPIMPDANPAANPEDMHHNENIVAYSVSITETGVDDINGNVAIEHSDVVVDSVAPPVDPLVDVQNWLIIWLHLLILCSL